MNFGYYSPVGFNPPVFDGAIPANPNAANPANGFLVKPLICSQTQTQFSWLKYTNENEKKKKKKKKREYKLDHSFV